MILQLQLSVLLHAVVNDNVVAVVNDATVTVVNVAAVVVVNVVEFTFIKRAAVEQWYM